MYIWDDGFYYLIVDLLTGFDLCQKWLRVKLVLILHGDFFKKIIFSIFGHKPEDLLSIFLSDLYTTLCCHIWANGKIVFCIPFLSVAALFFSDGKTSKIKFNILIDINNLGKFQILKESIFISLYRKISLSVWNKILIKHKHCFAATNCIIRGIKNNDEFFSNKIPMLLGGNYIQTTPVIPKGNKVK